MDSYPGYCIFVGALAFGLFVAALFTGSPLWAVLLAFGTSGFCIHAAFDD